MNSIWLTALLYVLIAVFGALELSFSSDDACKYVSGEMLFWIKVFLGTSAAAVGALKMFLSTSFSEHLKNQANKQQLEQPNKENEKINPPVSQS